MTVEPAATQSVEPAATPPPSKPLLLRLFFTLAWGTLAVAAGAAVWGLVAYFSNSVYVIIAIFIGLAVAAAVLLPLAPIHKAAALIFLPAVVAGTLLSIILGESLFTVLVLMRDHDAAFGEAFAATAGSLGEILSAQDSIMSMALGLIGALVGFFFTWKEL